MPYKLITTTVDIYQLPALDTAHPARQNIDITIGDLHSNAMKLLFMLFKHGVASNLTADEYKDLVGIYRTPIDQLTEEYIRIFNTLLNKIRFNNAARIILIGDELADRGSNDYFILKILEKLYANQVPVEIMLSNHGLEFIKSYEQQTEPFTCTLEGKETFLEPQFISSMSNMQSIVETGLIAQDEVLALTHVVYKQALRVISYSIDISNSEIVIYSHAGIGLNIIAKLAAKLQITYSDDSIAALAKTIDAINSTFQQYVSQNEIYKLYDPAIISDGYNHQEKDISNFPFECTMWNRRYDNIARPTVHNGYKICFVHGHDPSELSIGNVVNLDNQLGKNINSNQGSYTALYALHNQAANNISLREAYVQQEVIGTVAPFQHHGIAPKPTKILPISRQADVEPAPLATDPSYINPIHKLHYYSQQNVVPTTQSQNTLRYYGQRNPVPPQYCFFQQPTVPPAHNQSTHSYHQQPNPALQPCFFQQPTPPPVQNQSTNEFWQTNPQWMAWYRKNIHYIDEQGIPVYKAYTGEREPPRFIR